MTSNERDIGRMEQAILTLKEDVIRVETKLDKHIEEENGKLTHISQQLSMARFVWLTLKACVLTVAFVLAFKFGDVAGLWKALK